MVNWNQVKKSAQRPVDLVSWHSGDVPSSYDVWSRKRGVVFPPASATTLLPMLSLCSAGESFLGKEAQGWRRRGSPWCWDNTAPMPVVEASTSTKNGSWGSRLVRMGTVQKASWSFLKAAWALGFQHRDLGFWQSMEVRGAERRLKPWINLGLKLANPRNH